MDNQEADLAPDPYTLSLFHPSLLAVAPLPVSPLHPSPPRSRTLVGLSCTHPPWTSCAPSAKPWRPGSVLTHSMWSYCTARWAGTSGLQGRDALNLGPQQALDPCLYPQGSKSKLGVIVSAYMHYSKISAG